jgi:hypothetical protein
LIDLVDVHGQGVSLDRGVRAQASHALAAANSTSALALQANHSLAEVMSDIDRLLVSSDGFLLLGKWMGDASGVTRRH